MEWRSSLNFICSQLKLIILSLTQSVLVILVAGNLPSEISYSSTFRCFLLRNQINYILHSNNKTFSPIKCNLPDSSSSYPWNLKKKWVQLCFFLFPSFNIYRPLSPFWSINSGVLRFLWNLQLFLTNNLSLRFLFIIPTILFVTPFG